MIHALFIGASVASFGGGSPHDKGGKLRSGADAGQVQASEPITNIPKWNSGIPEWNTVSVLFQVEQRKKKKKFVNVPCLNQNSRNER